MFGNDFVTIALMAKEYVEAADTAPGPSSPAAAPSSSGNVPKAKLFSNEPDPSIHMLGLPESHPHLGKWVAVAIIAGAIAALSLVAMLVR